MSHPDSCRTAALPRLALALLMALSAVTAAHGAGPAQVPTMWDLGDLYPTPEAWRDAYDRTRAAAAQLDARKGTLGRGADSLLAALDAVSAVSRELNRLDDYATLKADEDRRVAANQERRQLAESLATEVDARSSWLAPEIVRLGADRVHAFEAGNRELRERFDFYLDNTLRSAAHTLGDESEGILAAAGTVLEQPTAIFGELADAELPNPVLNLPGIGEVRLDQPAYEKYRAAADRGVRKQVFDAHWGAWQAFEGTAGAMLTTHVMGDVFAARARRFDSALSAALFASNMPEGVYRTLVAQAHEALPTLHRYLRMRKAHLGITGDLAYYDNYPPMLPLSPAPQFTVADSEAITLAALAPLGEDYLALLRRGFAGKWMNALPHQGKTSGAYMAGSAYDVHPYLLLNHNDDYSSLSTLAHEWGHAVHTLLADASQPFDKSEYPTFIAESASIGNEMLLNDYLVAHARTKAEKLFYLGQGIESIRVTYFRQVLFAEFELAIHEEVEQGRPLSGKRLTDMYCGLLKRYYGDAEGVMKIDPAYCLEWAAVPHFYRHFYVWQYATSMAGAAALTDAILKEGPVARERYLKMLRAGGSTYPYDIYRAAGIDMASPAPYRALAARMNRLMDEIDRLEKDGARP